MSTWRKWISKPWYRYLPAVRDFFEFDKRLTSLEEEGTGERGPQGYQGSQGAQGPQGYQGYQGYQGSSGPQGGPGVTILTGSLLVVSNTIPAGEYSSHSIIVTGVSSFDEYLFISRRINSDPNPEAEVYPELQYVIGDVGVTPNRVQVKVWNLSDQPITPYNTMITIKVLRFS